MMKRQGYRFTEDEPAERAAGQAAFLSLARSLSRQGIGTLNPGLS